MLAGWLGKGIMYSSMCQATVYEISRLERRRELLAERIQEARAEYARGEVTHGTADELMKELAE
jgi:hypothetical protein